MTGTRRKSKGDDNNACDDFLQDFGARVREARLRNKLTIARLAEMTGNAPSFIFAIEKKASNTTLNTLVRLAAALKVSPQDLLPESEKNAMSLQGVQEFVKNLEEAIKQRQAVEDVVLERLNGISNLLQRLHPPQRSGKV